MKLFPMPPVAFAALFALGACTQFGMGQPEDTAPPVTTAPSPAGDVVASDMSEGMSAEIAGVPADPVLTSAPPPPRAANTQATLDTTTTAQRKQAAAPAAPDAGAKFLGTTVASLGSPTEPGFWIKTPLVKTETKGRVTNKANGKSSAVTLIPIDGPATGGSRLSLPAMRLIDASLTELTELEVTLGG
ncbi:hypothetical protein [Sulfitobacter sp.]|uniref:hypothetical protein n=1 Tax=Sulfitobacter sp. TaxID=1903071 RepID=UPI003001E4EB